MHISKLIESEKFVFRIVLIQYFIANISIAIVDMINEKGFSSGVVLIPLPFVVVSIVIYILLRRFGLSFQVLCIVPFISISIGLFLYIHGVYIQEPGFASSSLISYLDVLISKFLLVYGLFTLLPLFLLYYYNKRR